MVFTRKLLKNPKPISDFNKIWIQQNGFNVSKLLFKRDLQHDQVKCIKQIYSDNQGLLNLI